MLGCVFCTLFGAVVSNFKTNFWLICVEDKPPWLFNRPWQHVRDGEIVCYLGVLFGVIVSLSDMKELCLQKP